MGGEVLESEDLEGRGHAFALSASKHHPWNWLIFHQEVLVFPLPCQRQHGSETLPVWWAVS